MVVRHLQLHNRDRENLHKARANRPALAGVLCDTCHAPMLMGPMTNPGAGTPDTVSVWCPDCEAHGLMYV